MRKAFIGLSSPLGYNYTVEKEDDRPNPILDTPIGLFLFYDEIWFLDRKVCPYNMQELSYVHFLNEEYDLSELNLSDFSWSNEEIVQLISEKEMEEINDIYYSTLRIYTEEGHAFDSHSRSFLLGNEKVTPRPDELNVLIDDMISRRYGFDLITNTRTTAFCKINMNTHMSLQVTHNLLCEDLPYFQLNDGPYHPLLEDIRTDSNISRFRKKITEACTEKDLSQLKDVKADLQKQIDDFTQRVIMNKLSGTQIFKGACDITLGQVPILSNVYSGLTGGKTIYDSLKNKHDNGWIGLITNGRYALKYNNK